MRINHKITIKTIASTSTHTHTYTGTRAHSQWARVSLLFTVQVVSEVDDLYAEKPSTKWEEKRSSCGDGRRQQKQQTKWNMCAKWQAVYILRMRKNSTIINDTFWLPWITVRLPMVWGKRSMHGSTHWNSHLRWLSFIHGAVYIEHCNTAYTVHICIYIVLLVCVCVWCVKRGVKSRNKKSPQ